jgi:hypothetical protein
MDKVEVINLGGGWYDFQNIDQTGSYIKTFALKCKDDAAALKRAKKINGKFDYIIVAKGEETKEN